MSRLEQTLNKPIVVLVVGVVAVALNVLLYFGLFVPRMTPLIAHINPIGSSLPEAISKLAPDESLESVSDSPSAGSPSADSPSAGSPSAGSPSADSPSAGSPSADSPSTDS